MSESAVQLVLAGVFGAFVGAAAFALSIAVAMKLEDEKITKEARKTPAWSADIRHLPEQKKARFYRNLFDGTRAS